MSNIKVLTVDDEIDFITPLSKRLIKRGFDVRLASCGNDALDYLQKEEFDVVLLDICMPEMDGIKTLGKIKQCYPQIETVMLTAHANSDIVISSLAMGAYDYLIKPVDVDELAQKIEDAARQRKRNLAENDRQSRLQ